MKKLILPFIFFLSFGINVNAQCVADAGPDDVVCGMNYNMQGVLPPGYSGTWTSPNPYVMISMNYSPTTLVYTYQYGTIQLIWTIADSTCTDADTVNITFIQMPYPNAGADASACGNFVTLSAGNDTSMLGYWTGPAGTVFTPDNTTHYCNATILPLNTQQNLSFWWHQYNAYCIDSDEVIITFQPYANSNQVSAGFDGYTCDSVFQLHGIVQGINGSGQWSTNNMNDVIITNALDA
ncbi:MAG: hypothetical protein HY958_06800, partial [Bacteroidia bacterium]|nr:hypothetical protein [Bacteroidia bacterium]